RRRQVAVQRAHVGLAEEVEGEIAAEDPEAQEPDGGLVVPEGRVTEQGEPNDGPEREPRDQSVQSRRPSEPVCYSVAAHAYGSKGHEVPTGRVCVGTTLTLDIRGAASRRRPSSRSDWRRQPQLVWADSSNCRPPLQAASRPGQSGS